MTMLTDIAGLIQTNSLGTLGTSLFIEEVPEDPDLCVSLFQYAGSPTRHTFDGSLRSPGLQVRVRSAANDPKTGITRIEAIEAILAAVANETVGSGSYVAIRARSGWLYIGCDERRRPERTQNFEVIMA
jgi:hypothetical protein